MTNYIQKGDTITVAVTHPTSPSSGDPVRMGDFCGVAAADESSDGKTPVVRRGVVDVSVKAVDEDGDSAVALFDPIYYVDADTPKLSKKDSGKLFGFALETISAGSTDTINVLLAECPPVEKSEAVQYAEVSITAAEIKALRATPKTLVAAPGSGKVLEFLGTVLMLDAGSEVLAEDADNLAIKYTNGSGNAASAAIECTGFIDQSSDTIINAIPASDVIMAANAALVLHNTGDAEFTGNASNDAVLRVKVAYRVHSTGF